MKTSLKKIVLSHFLFIFLVLGLYHSSLAQDAVMQDSPVGIVVKLYKDFAWEGIFSSSEKYHQILGFSLAAQNKPVLEKYFDSALSSLLVKDADCNRVAQGEVCNLNFDPIFASQDPAVSGLIVKSAGNDFVEVQYTYPSDGSVIRLKYKLSKTPKGWRIMDIIYPSMNNTSLKKILEQK